MKYDIPIRSDIHADWCLREAERRYNGFIHRDDVGMFVVCDRNRFVHTDAVLRALSLYEPKSGHFFETEGGRLINAWPFDQWIQLVEDALGGIRPRRKYFKKYIKEGRVQTVRIKGERYVVDDPTEFARKIADYGV